MKAELKETMPLKAGGTEAPLFICGPGGSSLDAAWDFIREGLLPVWGAVLMESQSGGRGRMGRAWQSPPGHIYGALRLPQAPPFDGPGASLALAYFLAVALKDMGLEIRIKWPNDLIFEGGKTGGILLESKTGGLVAGVGFNLLAPPEGDWVAERSAGAPGPSALPLKDGPMIIWAALVKQIILLYNEKFGSWSMAEVVSAAEKLLFWLGREVRVIMPASEPMAPPEGLIGQVAGLESDGCLRLMNNNGAYKLWSGTVCLS